MKHNSHKLLKKHTKPSIKLASLAFASTCFLASSLQANSLQLADSSLNSSKADEKAIIEIQEVQQAPLLKKEQKQKKFVLKGEFLTYLNNLEGSDAIWGDTTIFGARLQVLLGYNIDDNHSVYAGGYVTQFMHDRHIGDYAMNVFYQYQKQFENSNNVRFLSGIMPRKMLKNAYYKLFFAHAFPFLNPNLRGFIATHSNNIGTTEAMVDWQGGNHLRGLASNDNFRVGITGHYSFFNKTLLAGFEGMFHHIKNKNALSINGQNAVISDDLIYRAYLGADFGQYIGLTKAYLGVALQGNAERFRSDNVTPYSNNAGVEGNITLQYKWLGVESIYYHGFNNRGLMTKWWAYGGNVYDGLPFFRAHDYSRTEIFLILKKGKFFNLKFSQVFHVWSGNFDIGLGQKVGNGVNFGNQQLLTLSIDTAIFRF